MRPSRHDRIFGACRTRPWLLVASLACLAGSAPCRAAGAEATAGPVLLDMAMTEAALGRVNPEEAVISFELYAQAYAQTVGVEAKIQANVFRDVEELLASVRKGRQKVLGLQVQEYSYLLRERAPVEPVLVAERSGRATERYLVVVRKDSDLQELGQLRGRSLIISQGQQMGLSSIWLQCRLAQGGLAAAEDHFARVEVQPRISSAVLPVLLGQADACLVAESGLQTMGELNPQIGRELAVIDRSPALLSFVICLRSDFVGPNRERAVRAYLEADEHAEGQQVLTLFGFDRLRLCRPADLEESLALIDRYRELTGATGSGGP